MRVPWLLPLVLPYVQGSLDACAEVTSTEYTSDGPSMVFEESLDDEDQCTSICDAYSVTPIGCTFAHWTSVGGKCRLYNEPLSEYLSHCLLLGGPPDLGDCPVTNPEDSSCDGLRESDRVYDGDVAEIIENTITWEECAELCNLNNHKAWTFRSEPRTECRLYTDSTKRCLSSITPSIIGSKPCSSNATTTTTTATTTSTMDNEGLLIVGGARLGGAPAPRPESLSSVELWHPSLPSCFLPDLPRSMYGHTVELADDRIITCLGETCEVFQSGEWPTLVNTTEPRSWGSSTVTNQGVMLLGGDGTKTTEVIPSTGETARPGAFDIRHARIHCTINISPKIAVITGGRDTYDLVTEYNTVHTDLRSPFVNHN